MPCTVTTLPDGGRAIVCTSGRAQRCACGAAATQLCDWKVPERRSGTCDRPLCRRCSHSPTPGKDLCPAHAAVWADIRRGLEPALRSIEEFARRVRLAMEAAST